MNLELDFCYPLEGHGSDSTEVGGKAASLDRLIAADFPVPEATVVTARAYRAFIRSNRLDDYLDELMKSDLPEPSEQAAEAAEVEARFLAASIPAPLREELEAGLENLLAHGPLAVRSSATAEDMVTASFAGQYDSYLNIKTVTEGLIAVRRCWASLWSPQSRAYRRREHIDERGLAMAVILQEMVEADWSGVLFTRDPQGSPTDMRIEAVAGLGDQLVSGKVTPRVYSVDRRTLAVRARSGSADLDFLEDLARLALRVEHTAGSPQDIEWTAASGGIRLVQSRPITVTKPLASHDDGFDSSVRTADVFTPRGVTEMLPGVVSPLLWSMNAPMLEDAFRQLLVRLGAGDVVEGRTLVGRFRGRAALNLSALSDAAEALGSSASEVELQYLGKVLGEEPDEAPKGGGLRAALRAWIQDRRLTDEVTLVKLAVEGIVQLDLNLERLPVSRLLAYRHRLRDLAWRIYAAEVASSSAAAGAYRSLELQLAKWLGAEGEASMWAQRLTAGALSHSSVGAARVNRLRDVYQNAVRSHPAIAEAIGPDPQRSIDRLSALGRPGRSFIRRVNRCVRSFGAQAVYGGRAWQEDLTGIWSQLAAFGKGAHREAVEHEGVLAELHDRLKGERGWRFKRIVTGQVVDTRLRLLDRMVREATTQLRNREEAKQALLVLGGEERRLIAESTDRLLASGHIQAPEEIEWFADEEVAQMLHGAAPVFSQEIARRRRALDRAREAGPLPETFSGDPDISRVHARPAGELEGWAASPGRVEGRARVLANLADGDDLQSGEIIVAHSTDPSWTPLFLIAGGIVLEEGGPLSHAAIVAREFGLPAVLNVPGATALIDTGQELLVDGTEGTVIRLDGGSA